MLTTGAKRPLERWLRYGISILALLLFIEAVTLSLRPDSANGGSGGEDSLTVDETPIEISSLPPLDGFQESVDRSLFAWNRQPIAPGQAPGEQQDADFSQWQLSGIVSYPGRSSLAIFVDPETKNSLVLEEEMYLGKWKVESIESEAVTFLDGDKEEVMQLQVADIELPEDKAAKQKKVESEVTEKMIKFELKQSDAKDPEDEEKSLMERLIKNDSDK